ncbi:acyltransferase family protein, partial [Vibrio splendidus]
NNVNFFLKRFFRIYPLYFILILFQVLFFICFSSWEPLELFKYFISNLFFLNFLSPTVGDVFVGLEVNAINGSLWTLKNEVFFYILIPVIFRLYSKFGLKFICFLYVISVVYMFYFNHLSNEKMLVQFPAQLRLFLSGIFVFVLFKEFDKIRINFSVVVCFILILLFRDNSVFRFTVYPLTLSVFLVYIVYYIKPVVVKFDFSYSFYIVHFPLIQLFIYFNFNPSNPLVSLALLFSITVFLSYLSEKYIEKRFVRLGRKIIANRNKKFDI